MELINGKWKFTEGEKKFHELNQRVIRNMKNITYSKSEFTLKPLQKGIYEDWKQGIGWYDHVEKYFKENGKHPEWFQKLIDNEQ